VLPYFVSHAWAGNSHQSMAGYTQGRCDRNRGFFLGGGGGSAMDRHQLSEESGRGDQGKIMGKAVVEKGRRGGGTRVQ